MMTYYAALDVGLRTTAVCIVDGDGKIQREKSPPSEVDEIVTCLHGFGAEIAAVGLESGTLTQWLTYGLSDAGFSAVVMEARHVKAALGAMRNKTDKNDASGIARSYAPAGTARGYITALTFRAAVDDPRRFRRSKNVAAHFGLTPRRHQSGERDNPGRISKAGDTQVRSALYAAANIILTRSIKWSSLKA